jgi:hypothetical protein
MVYPALLPLMRTPRLPAVDWTDAPADLNGLVRFAERRNQISACVPSHLERSLLSGGYSGGDAEDHNTLWQNSLFESQDLTAGPSKCEARDLITEQQQSTRLLLKEAFEHS